VRSSGRSRLPLGSAAGAIALLAALGWVAGSHARPATFPGLNGPLLVAAGDGYRTLEPRSQRPRMRPLRINGGDPVWSPDGRRLAFEDGGIRVGRADGRRSQRIVASGTAPAWSPDGSQIAFADRRGGIYLVGADGRHQRRLSEQGLSPEWSPDGREIAFAIARVGDVFILTLESGDVRRLTRSDAADGCRSVYEAPKWSPDGAEIALQVRGVCSWTLHESGYAATIRPDGTGLRDIALPAPGWMDAIAYSPVWAPDGSRLAIAQDPGQGTDAGLFERIEIVTRVGGVLRSIRSTATPQDWQPVCSQRGSVRPDRIRGRAAGDLACGLGGDDTITGGAGRDRLFGEDGNDRFFARDGEFDIVGCGAGRDTVVADRSDLVGRDCERVTRA
jgi:hypothetical protein